MRPDLFFALFVVTLPAALCAPPPIPRASCLRGNPRSGIGPRDGPIEGRESVDCHTILPRFAQEATAFNGAPSSGGILGALLGISLGRNGRFHREVAE